MFQPIGFLFMLMGLGRFHSSLLSMKFNVIIDEMLTTYSLPNYVGELTVINPNRHPLFTLMGLFSQNGSGFSPGQNAAAYEFGWQEMTLGQGGDHASKEGADAPDPEGDKAGQIKNVVQIFHKAVKMSYSRLGTMAQRNSDVASMQQVVNLGLDKQIAGRLMQMKADMEYVFWNSSYVNPADRTVTAPRTKGILEAITTNVISNPTPTEITAKMVLDLMQKAWENNGIQIDETRVLFIPPGLKRSLTKLFITDSNYQEFSRNVGGVALTQIITDFGMLNVALSQDLPWDSVNKSGPMVVLSMEELEPIYLEIPGKGFLFFEPLGTRGSYASGQLYGELGLKYGTERKHAKATNVKAIAGYTI